MQRLAEVLQTEKNDKRKPGESVRNEELKEIGVPPVDYTFLYDFYKLYLMIETKMLTPCSTQDNDT